MSFLKTLTTLAVGFGAAKGYDKFRKAGGMTGMTDALKGAGATGGLADQAAQMAEKLGIPGGAEKVREMIAKMGPQAAEATAATQAGLGSVIATMTAAASKGGAAMTDMFEKMTAGTPLGVASEENAKLMIRAMIEAAKADGAIDDDERARLMEHIKDAGPAEKAYVEQLLAAPADPAGLIAAAGGAAKAQVYATSLMALKLDSRAETDYLKKLAAGLGIPDDERDALHVSMGVPPITA
ncbi:MAG: DUF533 domain-containing protein [Paracoccaceae bacterium]